MSVAIEDMFTANSINVIRVGLHSIDLDAYVAGPWHPSFRELCQSHKLRNLLLKSVDHEGNFNVYISPKSVSKFVGQNRSNVLFFKEKNINLNFISDKSLNKTDFIVEEVN